MHFQQNKPDSTQHVISASRIPWRARSSASYFVNALSSARRNCNQFGRRMSAVINPSQLQQSRSFIYLSVMIISLAFRAISQPVATWPFDELKQDENGSKTVQDVTSGRWDEVLGDAWLVPGWTGHALQLDGITAYLKRPASEAPKLSGPFTLKAWLAFGAYPFNWCPLLQQQDGEKAGYFLGVGDRGQVAFHLAAGDQWQGVETKEMLPLGSWIQIVAVYEPQHAVTIYINGKPAASQPVSGDFVPANNADLWIGRNMNDLEPTFPVTKNRQFPTRVLFDGILDDLQVSRGAKSAAEIEADYNKEKPGAAPSLPPRILPSGPSGSGPFGAYYAKLKYYRGWDDYWRMDDSPDIVVRFDEAPFRFVFWRGTSYIPHWVTENGIWYNNEFTESFEKGLQGSAEPMSDKQCRFSQVKILESSPARVVVHWRYAPVDVNYTPAYVDPETGWADWTDETHILYPDGIGVRKVTAYTSGPMSRREWHEGIVVMGPGMSPETALDPAGLTLVNESAETHTYSWEKATPPKKPAEPANANIQLINTRSKYKPFTAVRSSDNPWFDVYSGEIRRDISIYPWWNHWPTAFAPSNGRFALAADRASHSSLTHIHWDAYASGPQWATKIMLQGMTDQPAAELAAITRSWDHPARLVLKSGNFIGGEFDPTDRAYHLETKKSPASGSVDFTLAASKESPVYDVALVIMNWGQNSATLTLNGDQIPRGSKFRLGFRQQLNATDMIVWIQVQSMQPLKVTLKPAS
jgi:hypothetical protein